MKKTESENYLLNDSNEMNQAKIYAARKDFLNLCGVKDFEIFQELTKGMDLQLVQESLNTLRQMDPLEMQSIIRDKYSLQKMMVTTPEDIEIEVLITAQRPRTSKQQELLEMYLLHNTKIAPYYEKYVEKGSEPDIYALSSFLSDFTGVSSTKEKTEIIKGMNDEDHNRLAGSLVLNQRLNVFRSGYGIGIDSIDKRPEYISMPYKEIVALNNKCILLEKILMNPDALEHLQSKENNVLTLLQYSTIDALESVINGKLDLEKILPPDEKKKSFVERLNENKKDKDKDKDKDKCMIF